MLLVEDPGSSGDLLLHRLGAVTEAGLQLRGDANPIVDGSLVAPAQVHGVATVRLPGTVAGESRRWTDAQATGAWGEGSASAVLLTCGVEAPGPSTLVCQTVKGIDWIIDDSEAPNYRFTSFGRTPAVEVYIDYDVVSGRDVLGALDTAVSMLPANGSVCTERPAG